MFSNSISSNGFFLPIFLAALFFAGCSAPAGDNDERISQNAAAVESSNDLTDAQSTTVRKMLDDVCSDSWCEGDYDWQFAKIVCHFSAQSCTITMRITDPAPHPPATYWRSCKTHDVSAYSDIVETAPNGFQSLTDAFFNRVSACVDEIEHELHGR